LDIDKGKIKNQQMTITLTVDDQEIEKHLQRASTKLSNKLKIPGFRKGKAPRSIVEQLVGRDGLVEESLQDAVPEIVNKAIDEEKIEVFSTPKVSIIDFNPKLKIEAALALKPNVVMAKVNLIKVDILQDKVGAKEVNKVLDEARDRNATWVPAKRNTKMGDLITVDFNCKSDESIIMDHSGIDLLLDIQFEDSLKMPGLMKNMTGISLNKSKKFKILLPEDYHDENFRGKEANYEVKLHEVKEKELPPLDDSLAKIIDPSSKDLKDVKKMIKKNLEQSSKTQWEQSFWDEYLKQITDISKFTIAEIMIDQETELLANQQKEMIAKQNIDFKAYLEQIGKSEENFSDELRESAELRIKRALIIEELSKFHKLEINDKDVEKELQEWKKQKNNSNFSDDQILDEIKYAQKREKLLQIMISEQKVK
jgi:trigger factor